MSVGLVALFVTFAATIILDVPIAFALILSSVSYLLLSDSLPLVLAAQRTIAGIDSFTLLAIPLFVLAGGLLTRAGLTERIIRLCSAMVGAAKGGHALAMVVAAMMFGALSGSGVADVVAIGSLMLPAMRERGYPPGFSASLLGCAGSLGTVIPPSIVMIVYGVATGTSIGQMFVGGILPGLMTGAGLMIAAWYLCRRNGWGDVIPFNARELVGAFRHSLLALVAPLIIVGGIRGGAFTPTEAGGIAVAYALLVGFFVTRQLTLNALWSELRSTAELTGAILLVVASASLFGWILSAERVPDLLAAGLLALTDNGMIVLMLMMTLLVLLGTFMESIAIILMLAPIFTAICAQFDIDKVHFGILLVMNLAIGANTPPLGIDLMAACRVAGISLSQSLRYLWPFLTVMVGVMMAVLFFPALTLR